MAKVFFSYAHEDEALRDQLEKHLTLLTREGAIETWHDRRIGPGGAIDNEIDSALETADIVLLLVSSDFLASDYCHDIEMRRALERHEEGLTQVIPVILRPCDWHSAAFGHLNAVPRDGKPVTQHRSLDEGFVDVARAIRRAAQRPSSPAGAGTAPNPVSPTTSETSPKRSSNLRIPRTFTDQDRDHFFDEALQYIADFYESSLRELHARNPEVETRFRCIDADRFEAVVYVNGEERSRCGIWRAQEHWSGSELRYSNRGIGSGNSFNESLFVENDGYVQYWKPMGFSHFSGDSSDQLAHHGASEYLWDMPTEPLRSH
jgi:hypothetical protein